MSHTTRILLALAAGAVLGLLLAFINHGLAIDLADAVQPIGRVWLNALQMTVVPLVAALVIIGVNSASDAAASGRTARRAIVVFIVLLAIIAAFTAVLAPAALSLLPRDDALVASLRAAFSGEELATTPTSIGDWLVAVIPSNAIAAAAAAAMLPTVVFSLFFGFALARVDPERRLRMLDLLQTVIDTMIIIVRWVLWAAPLGVFALMFAVCARVGVGVLTALGWYILLLCCLHLAATALMYVVVALAGNEPVRRFASGILPAQTIALSTQSSLATLPAMLECARTRLGYPLAVASLVLPMAVSLFRITSPVQYMTVAAFIAWIYGIDLGIAHLAAGAALATVISMGSVGLPGQAIFMTTNMPVVQSMGLPTEPLGILLAVDTIPDMFATLGNVTADLAATSVVTKQSLGDAVELPLEG
ncbi:MAG TPA: dicarboxylate/amino acid:cation symporter [Luteimonas sp.]|nr:dicarboxylate/amino acid:cation symporter [Luteimonas sp.]HRO26364.1 dicarboxylate/amino acid:cation symporter [Luteimonas sp.]HRP71307.1 dicarboxylate/amino acid:cation symporter [Luteimonas sp.]